MKSLEDKVGCSTITVTSWGALNRAGLQGPLRGSGSWRGLRFGDVSGKLSSLSTRPGQCALWFLLRGAGWSLCWKVKHKGRALGLFFH